MDDEIALIAKRRRLKTRTTQALLAAMKIYTKRGDRRTDLLEGARGRITRRVP